MAEIIDTNSGGAAAPSCACGHDHHHHHSDGEHRHSGGHRPAPNGGCICGHDHRTEGGVGHDRSMGKMMFALLGGILTLNSFLLSWLLPQQAFAADMSALFGAAIFAQLSFCRGGDSVDPSQLLRRQSLRRPHL